MSNRKFVAIYAGLFAITLVLLARSNWAMVAYRLLADGMLAVLWIASGWGWGQILPCRAAIDSNRALRIVTEIAIGLGVVSLLTLTLGLVGFLTAATSWAILFAGVAGACFALRGVFKSKTRFRAPHPLVLLTSPLLAVAVFAALVPPGFLWGDEPNGYDVTEYHLQIPREWYEGGRIVPLTHNVFSYLSQGVEVHYLLAMHLRGGPWAGAYLAQLMHVGFIALTIIAIYASAIQLGASPRRAALASVSCAIVPWMLLLAPVAYNEGGVLLFGALAIAWLLRRTPPSTIIAGVLAGFACGAKLSAVPYVLLAPAIAVVLVQRRVKHAVLYILIGMLIYSPWLLRTYHWTGNPLFPEEARLLGKAHFTDVQVERWDRANRYPRPEQQSFRARAAALWDQVLASGNYAFALIPFAFAGAFFAIRKPSPDRDGGLVLLLVFVMMALFWTFLTHLQGRFFTSAIPVCALMLIYLPEGWPATTALFAIAVGAIIALIPRIGQVADDKIANAVGLEGITLPVEDLEKVPAYEQLVLIGEARPFLLPHRKLAYRTVFDADVDDELLIDAWANGAKGPRLIDPNELRRFSKTYFRIPDPNDPHDKTYIVPAP